MAHLAHQENDGTRKTVIILGESSECLNAIRFAEMRTAYTGGGIEILSMIPTDESNLLIGVSDMIREEEREHIHAHFEVFANWMRDRQGIGSELVI